MTFSVSNGQNTSSSGTGSSTFAPTITVTNGTASINQFGSGFYVVFSPFKYTVVNAQVAGTSPQVWTSSTDVVPGAGGQLNNTTGSGPFGGGRGGMGGALLIEYIG